MSSIPDELDDFLLMPAYDKVKQPLGKFRPKLRPKIGKQETQFPHQTDGNMEALPPLQPDAHVTERIEEGKDHSACSGHSELNVSSLPLTQDAVTKTGNPQQHPSVVMADPNQLESVEVADMDFSMDFADDPIPPTSEVKGVGKFQPKAKSLCQKEESGGLSPAEMTTNLNWPPQREAPAEFITNELLHQNDRVKNLMVDSDDMVQISQNDGNFQVHPDRLTEDSQNDGNFQVHPDRLTEETTDMLFGMDSFDYDTQQPSISVASAEASLDEKEFGGCNAEPDQNGHHETQVLQSMEVPDNIDSLDVVCHSHASAKNMDVADATDLQNHLYFGDEAFDANTDRTDAEICQQKPAEESYTTEREGEFGIDADHWDVEDPKSQTNADAHGAGQKRVPRGSQKRGSKHENQVQVKGNEEVCQPTIDEPPKKKFSRSTRRKRRQVDKALLEMPEDEIDPSQISIKNLILLAEAKEKVANKKAAVLNKGDQSGRRNSSANEEQDQTSDHEVAPAQPKVLNYHSFSKKPKSSRWSKSETELFYQAIRHFGTDFAMMQPLFPSRTRHQMKLKFKNEERKYPLQVADALARRSKGDHSHFQLVIQLLQAQGDQNAKEDLHCESQGATEDEPRRNNEDEHQHGNIPDDDIGGRCKDLNGKVESTEMSNDSHGVFEWDEFVF